MAIGAAGAAVGVFLLFSNPVGWVATGYAAVGYISLGYGTTMLGYDIYNEVAGD